jgi:hypothetical protein
LRTDQIELRKDNERRLAELDHGEGGETGRTAGYEGTVGLMPFEEAGCHHAEKLDSRKVQNVEG